ncbi:MAG TPA: DUF6463 family protein, partial [Thermoleophilaceae bacterium]
MDSAERSRLPGSGRLLQGLAIAHTAVGLAYYRTELRSIVRDGVVAAVPNRGPKSTAFWFLVPSPLVWIAGRLLTSAEAAGDAESLRAASRAGVVSATVCVACMPISGFWGWLLISLRGLRQARR